MLSRHDLALRALGVALLLVALVATACTGAPAGNAGNVATPQATEDVSPDETQDGDDQGGDDSGGDASDQALCDLISEQEIADASGSEVTEIEAGGGCNWTVGEGNLINLRYEGSHDPGFEIARQICDEFEDVSGVGDEALWCSDLNVLYFNTGGTSLAVQLVYVLDEPARPPLDIATDVAELAADRL